MNSYDLIYNGGGIIVEDGDQPDHNGRANIRTAAPAEMVILVPPAVFGGTPTPLMPALNYELARQMSADGIENLDIDVYVREHFVPLPDSICGATGRFAVLLQPRDLLFLNPEGIRNLSKQPHGDSSLAVCHRVPEAAEWFARVLHQAERQAKQQLQLREKLSDRWAVPPCVRRLDWSDMSDAGVVEACRIMAQFYPFIGASEEEVWYHIRRLMRRHNPKQAAPLQAIVTCGRENLAFVGCEHPLLRQLCPAGGCFMKDVIDELQSPRLFT